MSLSPTLTVVLIYLCALMAMAFYTLLERKFLGYMQTRKGPNKVAITGLPQPLADALKLFLKEQTSPLYANIFPYIICPITTLVLALMLWALYPHPFTSFFMPLGVLFFLAASSLNVYTILGAGWASNSKYSLLGALRSVAQTISYEVSMIFTLLPVMLILKSYDFSLMNLSQSVWPSLMLPPLLMVWFTTLLAETNRTPFDFAEGESELVSGFNTEYSSGGFALIFMAEYTSILIMSLFTSSIFITSSFSSLMSLALLMAFTVIFASLFIWVRATLPRMRYDHLMSLTWASFLPNMLMLLLLLSPVMFLIS